MKLIFLTFLLAVTSIAAFSQTARQPSKLEGTRWGVVYDIPDTKKVKVAKSVPYSANLTVDIYSPPNAKPADKRPAVIFLNAIGDGPEGKVKDWGIYSSWPRLMAAEGMIGISMDADGEKIQESLASVFDFIAKSGSKYGIDPDRLGVYAASANVTQSAIFLMGPNAPKGIKAAALYYGGAPEMAPRRDLPVLFIIAESDMPRMAASLPGLWQRVAETKAPWTLQMASGMPHALDAFEDTDGARRIVQQTIAFWKSHLEPVPPPTWPHSREREIIAAIFGNDAAKAVPLLAEFLKENPNDGEAYSQYGRMLASLRRFDESADAYEKAVALGVDNGGVFNGLGQTRLNQKRWQEAINYLNKAVEKGNRSSLTYGQIAWAQLNLNRNEDAVKSYEKAFEAGIPAGANTRGIAYYNMACAYTRMKNVDKAFEALNKAVAEGYTNRRSIETDTDFEPLRSDPRFTQLLGRLPASGPNN